MNFSPWGYFVIPFDFKEIFWRKKYCKKAFEVIFYSLFKMYKILQRRWWRNVRIFDHNKKNTKVTKIWVNEFPFFIARFVFSYKKIIMILLVQKHIYANDANELKP